MDPCETFVQDLVVHSAGGRVICVDGVLVAQQFCSCSFLLHVSSSHQLGPKVEVLTLGLFKIKSDGLVCLLQVALVRVEHNGFVCVVCPHQLHCQPMDGRLEVRLFSVHHHPHILLLCVLEDLVQPVHHVAELHLLVLGESPVVVARDQRLKHSRLQVRHLQNLAQVLVFVYQRRPVEQMDNTVLISSHVSEECLNIFASLDTLRFESLAECIFCPLG